MAPFNYVNPLSGAGIREAQFNSLGIPKTGMVVSMDVGNPVDIHPRDKQTVGERLSYWAMNNTYGKKEVVPSGPLFKKVIYKPKEAHIEFTYVGKGLDIRGRALTDIEIADSTAVFHPADARIEGDKLIVSHPEIAYPKAVRYGFSNAAEPNLFNKNGLPATPFRTDSWPLFMMRPNIQILPYSADKPALVSVAYKGPASHRIHLTTDGSDPDLSSPQYEEPFRLDIGNPVRLRLFEGEWGSETIEQKTVSHKGLWAKSYRIMDGQIRRNQNLNKLVDGLSGGLGINDGQWVLMPAGIGGLEIELAEKTLITELETNWLAHRISRIESPEQIILHVSKNGKKYTALAPYEVAPSKELDPYIFTHTIEFPPKLKVKSIRLFIKHNGKTKDGRNARMALDEVILR